MPAVKPNEFYPIFTDGLKRVRTPKYAALPFSIAVASLRVRKLLRAYFFLLANTYETANTHLACRYKLRQILLFRLQQSAVSSVPNLSL